MPPFLCPPARSHGADRRTDIDAGARQADGNSAPKAAWSVTQKGRDLSLTATNAGDRRVRLASVRIGSGSNSVSFGPGLTGYVLGHSVMSWTSPTSKRNLSQGTKVAITGQTEEGPFDAQAVVQKAP